MSTSALKPLPIGISDFRKLRERNLEYIDKTGFIQQIVDDQGAEVVLFPRPRRFGKTLNLSTLRYFFEKSDEERSPLFEGTAVWEAGDPYRSHFQRYPTIFLTFKDLKLSSKHDWERGIREILSNLYLEYCTLPDSIPMASIERKRFDGVLNEQMEPDGLGSALRNLTKWLHRAHGEQVLVLIDEYDTPIHAAVLGGFGTEVLGFFRTFLGAGLKDNPHLFKGVITGILRVAKENIFSGLNNLEVYGILQEPYATCFGFTEAEVESLLRRAGLEESLPTVRDWYNGYLFGDTVIYNPWSVLNFIKNKGKEPRAFWLHSSGNELVRELLERYALTVDTDIRTLIDGGTLHKTIDENIVLSEVFENPNALWSLLLFSGYLKARRESTEADEAPLYALDIPNREVRSVYTKTFQNWMHIRFHAQGGGLEAFLRALFEGDVFTLEQQLRHFTASIFSYYDQARNAPETVPHGFVLGLCAVLDKTHRVVSNRESGTGRPDVLVIPRTPGRPGVVMEIKIAYPGRRTIEEALAEAVKQIEKKDYTAELVRAGAEPIHAYAMAFGDKDARVVEV